MSEFYTEVCERMLRYAKIDTQSAANVDRVPTTEKQFDLARLLEAELAALGVANVWLDPVNCVVYGTIPATLPDETLAEKGVKSVGFVAHMDTSPDVPNAGCKPWILKEYPGGDIVLNEAQQILLKVSDYPNLNHYLGQDLVLSDGTTLLGADDKAAITALMTAVHYLMDHPEIPHGPIQIAFTPDEEVGGLACNLDLARFGADVAYTIDGDYLGYYSYETFNATEAQLTIHGLNVHPGTAKDVMINAVEIGAKFISMLPDLERPQYTEGREGFFHPHGFTGTVEEAQVLCLIRDHDEARFNERISYVEKCVAMLNQQYGAGVVDLKFANGYFSMKKAVDQVPFMIDYLVEAFKDCGITPTCLAFRGGTDGSAISQRGLPCPNISAGYENAHSRYEYVSVQAMEKNVEVLIRLCERFAQ